MLSRLLMRYRLQFDFFLLKPTSSMTTPKESGPVKAKYHEYRSSLALHQ